MSIIKLEERIAQTVVDGLDLGVVLKGVRAELAANTGLLESSEGNLVGEHVVAVDPDSSMCLLASGFDLCSSDGDLPSTESVGNTDGGGDILGVDTGSKT